MTSRPLCVLSFRIPLWIDRLDYTKLDFKVIKVELETKTSLTRTPLDHGFLNGLLAQFWIKIRPKMRENEPYTCMIVFRIDKNLFPYFIIRHIFEYSLCTYWVPVKFQHRKKLKIFMKSYLVSDLIWMKRTILSPYIWTIMTKNFLIIFLDFISSHPVRGKSKETSSNPTYGCPNRIRVTWQKWRSI